MKFLILILITIPLISCGSLQQNQVSNPQTSDRTIASKTTVVQDILIPYCVESDTVVKAKAKMVSLLQKQYIEIQDLREKIRYDIILEDIISFSALTIIPNGDSPQVCMVIKASKAYRKLL